MPMKLKRNVCSFPLNLFSRSVSSQQLQLIPLAGTYGDEFCLVVGSQELAQLTDGLPTSVVDANIIGCPSAGLVNLVIG